MRVEKIKITKDGLHFRWSELNQQSNAWDRHTLISRERPRPEFYEALYPLRKHVIWICEMDERDLKYIMV